MSTGTGTVLLPRTNGPDCSHGVDCCCDPCREVAITCDIAQLCCKCVPRYLCFKFYPDNILTGTGTGTDTILSEYTSVFAKFDGTNWEATFTFSDGSSHNFELSIFAVGPSDLGYSETKCTWLLYCATLGIAHYYPVIRPHGECLASSTDTGTGTDWQSIPACRNPLLFHSLSTPEAGWLVIEPWDDKKIPFIQNQRILDTSPWIIPLSSVCGGCLTVCRSICVKYVLEVGGDVIRHDFDWNDEQFGWIRNNISGGIDGIRLVDWYDTGTGTGTGGGCAIYISIDEIFDANIYFDDSNIVIFGDDCGAGMDITAYTEDGHWIQITCGICTCWEYLCGDSRCACPSLCVTKRVGYQPPTRMIYTWNADGYADGWGVAPDKIGLGRDNNGNCVLLIDGFTEQIPIETTNSDLEFWHTEDIGSVIPGDLDTQNFVYGHCTNCGECLPIPDSYCIVRSPVLVATIESIPEFPCPCVTGTIYLYWDEFEHGWIGGGDIGCEIALEILFGCLGEIDHVSVIQAPTACTGPLGLNGTPPIALTITPVSGSTDDPLWRQYTASLPYPCCWGEVAGTIPPGGSFLITITE